MGRKHGTRRVKDAIASIARAHGKPRGTVRIGEIMGRTGLRAHVPRRGLPGVEVSAHGLRPNSDQALALIRKMRAATKGYGHVAGTGRSFRPGRKSVRAKGRAASLSSR